MQLFLRGIVLCLMLHSPGVLADARDIEGRWLSGDKTGWIDIRLIDGKPVGTASGSTNPDEGPRLDEFNPDPELRSRSLLGITILHGFEYSTEQVWKGGTIYDPNSGNTYKSTITLIDRNTIKVRGYLGLSIFGRSDVWIRDDPAPE